MGSEETVSARYRFVTFNVWGDYFGNPPGERDERQAVALKGLEPDFIALQEMTGNFWASHLLGGLSDEFEAVGRGMGHGGSDSFTPLLFRKGRFSLLEEGGFLFHPELDTSKGAAWAALRDKQTGGRVVAFSTHFWWRIDGVGDDYIRMENARRLHSELSAAAERNAAAIVGGGDLNAGAEASCIAELARLGWRSARDSVPCGDGRPTWHGYPVRGADGAYHGTGLDHAEKTLMLDHVFHGPAGILPCTFRVVTEGGVEDLSDHYPLAFDFLVGRKIQGNP